MQHNKELSYMAMSTSYSGLPQGNDKIRVTLSTAENFVPQNKNKICKSLFVFNPQNFRGSAEEWQPWLLQQKMMPIYNTTVVRTRLMTNTTLNVLNK